MKGKDPVMELLLSARRAYRDGSLTPALELFEEACWNAEDALPEAADYLARIALRQANLEAASYWLSDALTGCVAEDEALSRLVKLALTNLRPDEARVWCERVLHCRPDSGSARCALATLDHLKQSRQKTGHILRRSKELRRSGRYDEAVALIRGAQERNPGQAALTNELGQVFFERGEVEEARECYLKAHVEAPRDTYATNNLGKLEMRLGRLEEADGWYRRSLGIDGDDVYAMAGLGRICARTARLDDARDHFIRILGIRPGDKVAIRELLWLDKLEIEREQEAQAVVARSRALRRERRQEEAREIVAEALDVFLFNETLLNELGLIFAESGDGPKASLALDTALAYHPHSALTMCNLADLARLAGKGSKASRLYRQALRCRPESTHARLGLALVAAGQRRYRRAREWLEPVLEQREDAGEACRVLHIIEVGEAVLPVISQSKEMRRKRQYAKAERLLLRALARYDLNAGLLVELGLVAHGSHRFEDAREVFLLAYGREPANLVVLNMLGVLESGVHAGRPVTDGDTAMGWFRKALDVDGQEPRTLMNIGRLALACGNLDTAATRFEEVLKLDARNDRAMEGMGEVALRRGDHAIARKWLEKVWWDRESDSPAVLTSLSRIAISEGDFIQAAALLEEALARFPGDLHALTSLAYVSICLDRLNEAQALLEAAGREAPRDVRVLNIRGKLAQKRRCHEEARRWFCETLQLEPANIYAMVGLGWVEVERRRPQEAQEWFRKALELEPRNASALTGMGMSRARSGDYGAAEECYRNTLQHTFHPPALWHWFRLATATSNAQQLAWFIKRSLESGRLEDMVVTELGRWERRVKDLMAITREGKDPWPYVDQVSRELPGIYHAAG